jgi:hypothetical protein
VFLRVVRIVLIVAGLALLGIGASVLSDTSSTSGSINALWVCEPERPSSTSVKCQIRQGSFTGPGSSEVLDYQVLLPVGLGLILAAIALGQFERPRDFAAAQQPGRPPGPSGPPHPGPQPGPHPGQQPGPQQGWAGQPPGPPQHY